MLQDCHYTFWDRALNYCTGVAVLVALIRYIAEHT